MSLAATKEIGVSPPDLARLVKDRARAMGFDLVAITTAESFTRDQDIALERIDQGLMDGLAWYTPQRVRRGSHPQELLPDARSIITVAMSYLLPDQAGGANDNPAEGRVARYAWGDDYHQVMKRRLRTLANNLQQELDQQIGARWYVDDGPMLDRAAAQRAGLGWFGKNTNILTSSHGSWVFLGQLITDLELEPDLPLKKTCGECRRCIDACPTGAIVGPYVLDNTRCISYQTIENRGVIPHHLRPLMGDWVFGCDICQEVCPVNVKAMYSQEQAFQKRRFATLELVALLQMTEEEFRQRFANSPIKRAKLVGLQRNACVALGNSGDPAAISALAQALDNGAPLVRGHAAWALGRLGGGDAQTILANALATEEDPEVREEIERALGR